MFSGIVIWKAKIFDISWWTFVVENTFDTQELSVWCSIAHDGACMTITSFSKETYSFFAMQESLSKTNFWQKKAWETFNVEQCIRYGDRVDWHFVTGHIDTTWTVKSTHIATDWSMELVILYPQAFNPYIISKWSIAINGVSLTVVQDDIDSFSVRLIPITQELTNLWTLTKNHTVNLEYDMLAKYAYKHAQRT